METTQEAKTKEPGDKAEKKREKEEKKHKKDKDKSQAVQIRFDSPMALEEAVAYFEAIAAGMKKGRINLRQGDRTLGLTPPSHLQVRVKGSKKEDGEKLAFQISWSPPAASELTISSE